MELILIENVEKVGSKGDVIKVRDGFGRNFLLPRGLAIPSTRTNKEFVAEQKVRMEKRRAKERTAAETKSQELEKLSLKIEAPAGDQDKLFGSITAEDIRQALAGKGFDLDKKKIHLKDPIRSLGSHTLTIEIYPQVKATVTVEVVRKS